jgi:hypothetical protein
MKRKRVDDFLVYTAKRIKSCETTNVHQQDLLSEDANASTLPIEMIGMISSYFKSRDASLVCLAQLNKHYRHSLKLIFKDDLTAITHVQMSRSPSMGLMIIDPDDCNINSLTIILGFPEFLNNVCSKHCYHDSTSPVNCINLWRDETYSNDRIRRWCEALYSACGAGETESALRILTALIHPQHPIIDHTPMKAAHNIYMAALVASTQSSNCHTLDSLLLFAKHFNVKLGVAQRRTLINYSSSPVHPSIAVRIYRLACHNSMAKVFKNDTSDLTQDCLEKLCEITCHVRTSIQLATIISTSLQSLEAPVTKLHNAFNQADKLNLLQGDNSCVRWFLNNMGPSFRQQSFDTLVTNFNSRSCSTDSKSTILDCLLSFQPSNADEVPILRVDRHQLIALLLAPRTSLSSFKLAYAYFCKSKSANDTLLPLENTVTLVLNKLRGYIAKDAKILDKKVTARVRSLTSNWIILLEEYKQWLAEDIRDQSPVFVPCLPNNLDVEISSPPSVLLVASFLEACILQLQIHFIPVTKNQSVLYCITSVECQQKLWITWMAESNFPGLSICQRYLQYCMFKKRYEFLQWTISLPESSKVLLVSSGDNTNHFNTLLWTTCLSLHDMTLCKMFDIFPKPCASQYSPEWEFLSDETEITYYDYALRTGDLDWIDHVAQFVQPTPERSLNFISFLGESLMIDPAPPCLSRLLANVSPKKRIFEPMLPSIALKLLQKLHALSPEQIIPPHNLINMLKRFAWNNHNEFYQFTALVLALFGGNNNSIAQ